MKIVCPFCQTAIIESETNCSQCKKVRTRFKKTQNYSPSFICHHSNDKVNYYQINVEIDGNLYGYDSYQTMEPHTDFLICQSSGLLSYFAKFHGFTQIPKSRDDIERAVKRVLNLKAFL